MARGLAKEQAIGKVYYDLDRASVRNRKHSSKQRHRPNHHENRCEQLSDNFMSKQPNKQRRRYNNIQRFEFLHRTVCEVRMPNGHDGYGSTSARTRNEDVQEEVRTEIRVSGRKKLKAFKEMQSKYKLKKHLISEVIYPPNSKTMRLMNGKGLNYHEFNHICMNETHLRPL